MICFNCDHFISNVASEEYDENKQTLIISMGEYVGYHCGVIDSVSMQQDKSVETRYRIAWNETTNKNTRNKGKEQKKS